MSRWPDHRGGWPWPRPGLVGGPGPPFGPYYGGSWPGLPVQPQMLQSLSPAEALESVQRLRKEGADSDNLDRTLAAYQRALEICDNYGYESNATELNRDIAAVYLKKKEYELALRHATECIHLDAQFGEGYYYRAEANKVLAYGPKQRGYLRPELLQKAVKDYVQCYVLAKDTDLKLDTLCLAIMLATDNNCTNLLKLSELNISQHVCTKLSEELLAREETTALHLKFLVVKDPKIKGSGMASSLSCDLSGISCSDIFRKPDLELDTLQSFLKLGVTLEFKDIERVVDTLPDSKVDIISILLKACTSTKAQLVSLGKTCLLAKKFRFAEQVCFSYTAGSSSSRDQIENFNKELLHNIAEMSSDTEITQLIYDAINEDKPDMARALLSAGRIQADQIDLASLIQSGTLVSFPQLLSELLSAGVSPNGGEIQPLDAVLSLQCYTNDRKAVVATFISALCSNAELNVNSICVPKKENTTLVHIATQLAIETGNIEMLDTVCSRCTFPEGGALIDSKGQTPFHIAMKVKRPEFEASEKVCKVLSNYCVNPDIIDNSKKKPADYSKSKDDKRVKILQKAALKFKDAHEKVKRKKSKKAKGKRNESEPATLVESMPSTQLPTFSNPVPHSENPLLDSVKARLIAILDKDDSYFHNPVEYIKQPCYSHNPMPGPKTSSKKDSSIPPEDQPAEKQQSAEDQTKEHSDSDTETEDTGLDGLPWEVEGPEKVKKFFKKTKNDNHGLHKLAKQKIRMLATGDWHGKICKEVVSDPKKQLVLYETRLTKDARILWEVAKQFSARCTGSPENSSNKVIHVYSEVIRIWDIVLDHDQLDRAIKHIRKSHQRGCDASVKLLLIPDHQQTSPQTKSRGRLPRKFRLYSELEESEATNNVVQPLQFIPAGCTKENEHNVITFYQFSDILFESMLKGKHDRRDFPIKEWPGEHDIIQMPYDKESILLLGRSGTGKTTCCLYRLWNQFQTYWKRAINAGPLLARKLPASESAFNESGCCSSVDEKLYASSTDVPEGKSEDASLVYDSEDKNATSISEDDSASDDEQRSMSEIPEHLHLIFISKNYVLSAQMKKRFYDMAAANLIFESHMPYEDKDLPTNLVQIEDFAYPLFLTTRQFFLLLDNSLGNGETFFPRAKDGSLEVKILSSDYDHENPDTLLDLIEEESDDEDDEIEDHDAQQEHDSKKKPLQMQEYKEVTASLFEKQIWPDILKKSSRNCKEIDPLLVWMEIKSFIKGSRQAVESEKGYLSEEEYEVLGKKMAPNFPGNRSEIYELFKLYQNFLQRERHQHLFDECDFIHSIHTRLKNSDYLDWSIHNFYVDEVQDFTQAELSVLLQVCRNPNGLFLTGDTAQSIMRGVSFRFDDLRSLFYDLNEEMKQSKASIPIKVPHVRQLGINFRSHIGILQLAASIIDLLMHFFPSSFDRLPEDKGMFPGPIPTLLHSCNVSDLAVLLRGNKREASSIEFGAHQVIIVQSEDAKKALPNVLKAGIVLTVFEAKGLEFDDVLLYDFFADSKVAKEWRVVTSFIGLARNAAMIQKQSLSFESQPRPLDFNEKQHKSLNSELKYLYTAVTRAKCNLWIYDSNEGKRLPVFDYWHKRGLAKVIQIDDISKDESGLFVTSSTKEEWEEQGDYFKKKQLWEPAKKCYQKAGHPLLEMEAEAYSLVQQAREHKGKEMQDLYLKAVLAFLNCDQFCHEVKRLANAATCLKNAKRYGDAAKLFEKLGQHEKARRGFLKSKNLDGLANLKEKEGDHSGAVQVFLNHNRKIDALKRAAAYESKGISLNESLCVDRLAIKVAKVYTIQKDSKRLEDVLEFVQDVSQKIKFLKDACMYSKACDLHIHERQFTEAYRIFSAQAMYSRGIKLAEEQRNSEMQANFIFQAAVAHMDSTVDPQLLNKLKELSTCKLVAFKAHAFLLLGKLTGNAAFCRQALSTYKAANNVIGEVESFNALIVVSNPKPEDRAFISMAVSACKAAKTVIDATENQQNPTPSSEYCMNQVNDFYCLQRHRHHDVYLYTIPSNQDIWVKSLITKSCDLDPDGMIKIDISVALNAIRSHIEQYISKWTEKDLKVEIVLRNRMHSFPFHKQLQMLEKGGHLQESFLTYPPERLTEYLRTCLEALALFNIATSKYFSKAEFQATFSNFFSPQATVYLPVNKSHCSTVRTSKAASKLLSHMAADRIARKDFKLDNWLDIWRIHCILGRGSQKLGPILAEQARHVNIMAGKITQSDSKQMSKDRVSAGAIVTKQVSKADDGKYQIPHTFVYNSADKKYAHVFSMWLKAYSLIHKQRKVIISSKIIVEHFIQIIAKRRSLRPTISVINLVNIACIFSTALLAVTSQCCQLRNQNSAIVVPNTYPHIVKFFDCLTCQESSDTWLLNACVEEVKRSERANSLPKLHQNALELLKKILDVLVGRYNEHCNVLRYAVRGYAENGEAQHCLILTLTLFGNLICTGFLSDQVAEYQKTILDSLQSLSSSHANTAIHHLNNARTIFATANSAAGAFLAVNHLILVSGRDAHFVRIKLSRRDGQPPKLETPSFPIQQIVQYSRQTPLPQLSQFVAVAPPQPLQISPTVMLQPAIGQDPNYIQQLAQQQQHTVSSYASVASPHLQPTLWNPTGLSVNVTPSYPAGATPVGNVLPSSNTTPDFHEPQTVTDFKQLSTPAGITDSQILTENIHNQSGDKTLAKHQLLTSQTGDLEKFEASTIPLRRESSYTETDETELEDPEADAPAMNEELREALASTVDVDKIEIQDSTKDDQMWSNVDDGVCRICGVPLSTSVFAEIESDINDESSEGRRREEVVATSETRQSHIRSQQHKEKERQYEVFCQKLKMLYDEYKEILSKELEECQRIEDPPSYLETLTIKIQQEISSNDQKVENYKRSCEWREGASEIENYMVDAMNSLIQQAKKECQRAITDKSKEQSMKQQQSEQLSADDEFAGAEFEKEEPIEYSGSVVEEEKQKERKKKQSRKRKHKN